MSYAVFGQEKQLAEERIATDSTSAISSTTLADSLNILFKKNNEVFGNILILDASFREAAQSIRLQENYLIIQQQQATNDAMMQVRRSIRQRTYISLGVGLLSSAIFILTTESESGKSKDGLRYLGVGISMSIPIYSLLTMKKQMDRLAPIQPIDYSSLQNPGYPVTVAAQDYYTQFFKSEIFYLHHLHEKLYIKYVLVNNHVDQNPAQPAHEEWLENQQHIYTQLTDVLIPELRQFKIRIGDENALNTIDHGTSSRLRELNSLINKALKAWDEQHKDISRRLQLISQLTVGNVNDQ